MDQRIVRVYNNQLFKAEGRFFILVFAQINLGQLPPALGVALVDGEICIQLLNALGQFALMLVQWDDTFNAGRVWCVCFHILTIALLGPVQLAIAFL